MRNPRLKFASFVLSIVFVLTIIPSYICLADTISSGVCGPDITYTLDSNGTLRITGSGDMCKFSYYEADSLCPWEDYDDKIKKVVFSGNITSIGDSSFYGCINLTSVSIPSSVTYIGSCAFLGCQSLKSIVIPNSVTKFGVSVFDGCTSLESVSLSSQLSSIPWNTFGNCSSLTSVTVPYGITTIEENAFGGCSSLVSIDLPDSINMIENSAFYGCSSLESFIIPNNVSRIYSYTFYGCTNLKSITIPVSVTSINDSAFYECDSLTDVYYGGTSAQFEQTYYYYPFDDNVVIHYDTYILNIVKQPKDCAGTIGSTATFEVLANADWLTYQWQYKTDSGWVNSGASGSKTSKMTFQVSASHNNMKYRCVVTDPTNNKSVISNAATLYVVADDVVMCGVCGSKMNWTLYDNGKLLISGSGLMDGWESAADVPWADYRDDITSVVFSGDITYIGQNAFNKCDKLTSVSLPDSLRTIYDYAFADCVSLRSIILPDSLSYIGYDAFAGCESLKSINLPEYLSYIRDETFIGCTSLENVVIPFGIYTIGEYAFAGCTSLDNVVIPNSVYSIGDFAFCSCPNLANLTLSNNLYDIQYASFANCTSLTSVTIPSGVESIEDYAFLGCTNLSSIFIPDTVTSISYFEDCNSLTDVYYCGTQAQFQQIDGYDYAFDDTVEIHYGIKPISITEQPSDYMGAAGSTAAISVTATGTGLKYQWQVYSDKSWKNTGATGAKTSKITFNVTSAHDGMKYRCVITDSYGQKIISNAASVYVVGTPLTITKQPSNYTGTAGSTATFSVTASGTGLKYQWQVYSDGAWSNSGATGSKTNKISFNVTSAHNGKKYRCVITDSYGQKVTSNTVTVNVSNSLAITKQPVNYTGAAGSTASFSVTATGTGLTYQWQVYSNGAWSNSNASGSKTNKISFNVTNNHNGNKYRCIVKDSIGNKVYSNTATITVTTPLTITKQPSSFTGAAGSTATFSVTVTGTGLTYQWQVYSNGAWSNSNANGSKTNK
ncbi:MAG: leucine-rich repeat protein, partial [Clostridiales bacterium]|nr:leucine-rich repeat protein [Clostridiales bacterium]